jgi:hypothetical protein
MIVRHIEKSFKIRANLTKAKTYVVINIWIVPIVEQCFLVYFLGFLCPGGFIAKKMYR